MKKQRTQKEEKEKEKEGKGTQEKVIERMQKEKQKKGERTQIKNKRMNANHISSVFEINIIHKCSLF